MRTPPLPENWRDSFPPFSSPYSASRHQEQAQAVLFVIFPRLITFPFSGKVDSHNFISAPCSAASPEEPVLRSPLIFDRVSHRTFFFSSPWPLSLCVLDMAHVNKKATFTVPPLPDFSAGHLSKTYGLIHNPFEKRNHP